MACFPNEIQGRDASLLGGSARILALLELSAVWRVWRGRALVEQQQQLGQREQRCGRPPELPVSLFKWQH